jgi:hypothetical protein
MFRLHPITLYSNLLAISVPIRCNFDCVFIPGVLRIAARFSPGIFL